MSTQNSGGPAFPQTVVLDNASIAEGGMTLRQYAAIHLRVPDSGEVWLDDMIRSSLRDEIAGKVMSGVCAGQHSDLPDEDIAEWGYTLADKAQAHRDRT